MSDDVGVISVETREQLARIHGLRRVAQQCRLTATGLVLETPQIPGFLLAAAILPPDIGGAHAESVDIAAALRATADQADALAEASMTATTAYADAEAREAHALGMFGSIAGAVGGVLIGAGVRTAALLALPAAAMVAVGAAPNPAGAVTAGVAIDRGVPRALAALSSLALDHPELISNPLTANLVRELTNGADEAIASAVGVPPLLSVLLGGAGLGRPGTESGTRQILAALRAGGAYHESQVATSRALPARDGSTPDLVGLEPTAPTTLRARVERIPRLETDGGAQVRIERYSRSGRPDTFAVYISGTAKWGPTGSTTPFDFTSDLSQKAGERSGAYRAVEQAMEQAGVQRSSKVVFVGHSLGGLVAHDLAASGEWNAAGVLEVGSPPSDHPSPRDVPDIVIENDSDIVPALGERAADDCVLVRAHPFDPSDVPATSPGDPVPAHSREVYARMAGAADRYDDPQLRDAVAAINSVSDGASLTTSFWTSIRVDQTTAVGSTPPLTGDGAAPLSAGRAPARE